MVFWDTSALVKAYAMELGTPSVLGALKATRGRRSLLTELVVLETLTVLSKQWRARSITRNEYTTAVTEVTRDYSLVFDVVEVDESVRENAFQLTRRYRDSALGAMDLLHLATAMIAAANRANPLVFAAADRSLVAAAAAEGLRTFNPETDSLSKLLRLLSR